MSALNPDTPSLSRAQATVFRIANRFTKQLHDDCKAWCGMADLLWANTEEGCSPAELLGAYGVSAKASLTASRNWLAWAMPLLAADATRPESAKWLTAIQTRLAAIPAFTEHEDGTVTLV